MITDHSVLEASTSASKEQFLGIHGNASFCHFPVCNPITPSRVSADDTMAKITWSLTKAWRRLPGPDQHNGVDIYQKVSDCPLDNWQCSVSK